MEKYFESNQLLIGKPEAPEPEALINWGMLNLGFDKLTALTPVSLADTHRVLERAGMKKLSRLSSEKGDLYLFEINRCAWQDQV